MTQSFALNLSNRLYIFNNIHEITALEEMKLSLLVGICACISLACKRLHDHSENKTLMLDIVTKLNVWDV